MGCIRHQLHLSVPGREFCSVLTKRLLHEEGLLTHNLTKFWPQTSQSSGSLPQTCSICTARARQASAGGDEQRKKSGNRKRSQIYILNRHVFAVGA